MSKVLRIAVPVLLALGLAQGASGATTHSYKPAAHAKCRADFVKRTERVKVHGKLVREAMCVYVAPKVVSLPAPVPVATPVATPVAAPVATPPVETTTTTTTPAPQTLDFSPTLVLMQTGGGGEFTMRVQASLVGLPAPASWPVDLGQLTISFSPVGSPYLPASCSEEVIETPQSTTEMWLNCPTQLENATWSYSAIYSGSWYTAANGERVVVQPTTAGPTPEHVIY